VKLYWCAILCGHSLKVVMAFFLNMSWYYVQIYLSYRVRYHLMKLHLSSAWELHASPPFKILIRISGRDSFKGGRLWYPRCLFHVMREFILISNAQWRFLFLDRIYLLLSSYFWRFHRFLNLFDLKNSQIWSLLKLLFLKANANSKVNIISQLLSRLIYSNSR
jgi:hypothetical protein